jgi:hypothetical protein
MKTGKTLTELAAEIERQQNAKKDYVVPTEKISFVIDDVDNKPAGIRMAFGDHDALAINSIAHQQIGEHVKIPKPYYDRMLTEAPDLLATNIDRWFKQFPAARMVRTMDNRARAFLSDKFRPLEYFDLAEAVMPTLLEMKLEIMSCDITETRMYIKAVDPRIKQDVPSGRKIGDGSHVFFDTCSPGIIISNSEVGYGRLSVDHGIFTKVCTNLAVIAQAGMKRTHLGARHEITENLELMMSDKTKAATNKAIWMQVRDVVKAAFDEMRFKTHCDKLAGMATQKIEGDPIKVVEFSVKKFGATETEGKTILKHLIEGGDLTRYGLLNSWTRAASDLQSYDRASEFEKVGGYIMELPKNQWMEMAQAA